MGRGLKGINYYRRNDDKSINSCKVPPSSEEVLNTYAVITVESDNSVSECNNDIVTEMDDSDDVSVKPYSPSSMLLTVRPCFIFGVEYIY